MDLDPCGNDNFYDEIASFMPQPGDYTLDDLDEILRSTDSQLDSSIDLTTFVPHHAGDFQLPRLQSDLESQLPQDDFNFNFAGFPSPATTNQSSSAYTPPYNSQRNSTSSSSSMEEDDDDGDDHFNPDEFINFLNDDDIKIEEMNSDTLMKMNESGLSQHNQQHQHHHHRRNTPSPTGSCTSSSGSSTSGVQSDASSTYAEIKEEATTSDMPEIKIESPSSFTMPAPPAPISKPAIVTPVTVLQPLAQVQPVNLLQSNLIPVKTVPISAVTNLKVPTPLKVVAPKSVVASVPTVKVITSAATSNNGGKITPPTNSKPKTIFLSSNDFKALMQKMNTNGKGGGAKITGGINGQMPKIIMKTANGKVITANKIVQPVASTTPSSSSSSQHQVQQNFVPKIVKTTTVTGGGSPLMVKQQQLKLSSSNLHSTAVARSHPAQDRSIYRGLVDEKMFKKQQRMIKNRESASLSRKKKKEYVVSLESRINNLEKENYTLKGENTSLRSQLVAFAQTCHCKHSNISDFILNSLNVNTKETGITTATNNHGSNRGRGGGGGGYNSEQHHPHHAQQHHNHHHHHHHVKIAPKPPASNATCAATVKNIKQRMSTTSVKKNVAVLFAMAFMVTLNVGNFQTYLNKNSIESALEQQADTAAAAAAAEPLLASNSRRLLWVESESEFNEKLNRSKRSETELLEVPPLHFLRPNNRSGAEADEPPPLKCGSTGVSFNQTENQRLASNLHKWIGGNDYLNLSLHDDKYGNNELENSVGFKLAPDYFELKSIDLPLQRPGPRHDNQKRKIFIQSNQIINDNKQRKVETTAHGNDKNIDTNDDDSENSDNDDNDSSAGNSLDLFKPKISDEYVRLFKGIKRQDDTFYVVSFNSNNLLLPASAYNKSARPKMSLLMPAGDPSLNGDIVLMQIDCDVVNTTEVELKSHMIPEALRPSKFTHTPNPNDVANNETGGNSAHPHKRQTTVPPPRASATTNTETKERRAAAPVRTYFMMGPKNQAAANAAAAAALKRKPTIVKLSGNESFVAGGNGVRNSTLFAKMRETVESESQFTSG